MPFQISPGVNVTEFDLTTVVPAVSSSVGALAGIMNWGPVGERRLIDSEASLVATFGRPSSNNAETFFAGANFLLAAPAFVVRAANTTSLTPTIGALSAIANVGSVSNVAAATVKNNNAFPALQGTFDSNILYVAKYPGAYGNSLRVSVCDSQNAFSSVLLANGAASDLALSVSANLAVDIGSSNVTLAVTQFGPGSAADANTYAHALTANLAVGDVLSLGNSSIGVQTVKIVTIGAVSPNTSGAYATLTIEDPYRLATAFSTNSSVNSTIKRTWEFASVLGQAPQQSDYVANFGNTSAIDTMHVVVVDEGGKFTGTPGAVLETYVGVSRATDAKTISGAGNYYQDLINNGSRYIWVANDRSGAESNTAALISTSTNLSALDLDFVSGTDGYTEATAPLSVLADGFDLFKSAEDVDVSLVIQGKPMGGSITSDGITVTKFQLANYIIDNITSVRKDCIALITPPDEIITSNPGNEAVATKAWGDAVSFSTYAALDSGYKYTYDRYNNVYRYVPSNGDIAALCAMTDKTRDPWWSPAGFNRGHLKNVIKLRWNPRQADRDLIYPAAINPLVTFPGQGTVLYGDRTHTTNPSAFDRINVRRLFIILEKAIATAAKFSLFEFNDAFTQAQFRNMVNPYLRDIKGRRGITDFLVVCDGTNNTPQVIDANQFVGSIYIKPNRSINYISLNFVAVGTGVQFSEIVSSAGIGA